ncbi:helix-turn-helix transcriptional regulator [Luteimonas saliphila]|uniref:helix-turn-helix transcriptional regulator n=1 Tax=Luteimonas saliphila TaxID=2804919 RepID=UPI00192DAD82|nr:helix-turn-helix transcriptional regulator [Luteimonas saliphila]
MTPLRSRPGQSPAASDAAALGGAVRRARKAYGLTQSQLAGLAGTGLRFISELERGKPNVALDKVLAVLAVLGLRLQAVEAES